nr:MAG TPA: hypothetical protein [Caudoviricetes sp.]
MTRHDKIVLDLLIIISVLLFVLTVIIGVLYIFNIYIHNDEKEMFVFFVVSFLTFLSLCFMSISYAFVLSSDNNS